MRELINNHFYPIRLVCRERERERERERVKSLRDFDLKFHNFSKLKHFF